MEEPPPPSSAAEKGVEHDDDEIVGHVGDAIRHDDAEIVVAIRDNVRGSLRRRKESYITSDGNGWKIIPTSMGENSNPRLNPSGFGCLLVARCVWPHELEIVRSSLRQQGNLKF
jgi:hypothetical protein